MTLDGPPGLNHWANPESSARVITDSQGVEWEVYDESTWSLELALEWDFLPQTENPGLIFASRAGRRRLWPCPEKWQAKSDPELVELLSKAKVIF